MYGVKEWCKDASVRIVYFQLSTIWQNTVLEPETWKVDVILFYFDSVPLYKLLLLHCVGYSPSYPTCFCQFIASTFFKTCLTGLWWWMYNYKYNKIYWKKKKKDRPQSLAVPARLLSWVQDTMVALFLVVTRHPHRSTIAKNHQVIIIIKHQTIIEYVAYERLHRGLWWRSEKAYKEVGY